MNGCIYRTKDGECDLWTDGKHKSFCDTDCTDKHPSNADRIRAMTDEELAWWLAVITDHDKLPQYNGRFMDGNYSVWSEWLKSPADGGDI